MSTGTIKYQFLNSGSLSGFSIITTMLFAHFDNKAASNQAQIEQTKD